MGLQSLRKLVYALILVFGNGGRRYSRPQFDDIGEIFRCKLHLLAFALNLGQSGRKLDLLGLYVGNLLIFFLILLVVRPYACLKLFPVRLESQKLIVYLKRLIELR